MKTIAIEILYSSLLGLVLAGAVYVAAVYSGALGPDGPEVRFAVPGHFEEVDR